MGRILTAIVLVSVLMAGVPAYARSGAGAAYDARTGDTTLDATLGDLNVQTQGKKLSEFISNMSLSYNIPRIKLEDLVYKVKMTPADVYMTVGIANISGKPIDAVIKEYNANKGKGWGVIAKKMGIKPGSRQFHALKKGGLEQLGKAKGKGEKEKGRDKGGKGKGKGKSDKGKKGKK